MAQKARSDEFAALWSNPVSRRSLLRAVGYGAGLAAAGSALSGCTAAAPDDRGTGGTPKAGGTFQAGMYLPFANLDPSTAASGGITINNYLYETLYRPNYFAPDQVIPDLATELPRQVDPTTYRIKLRENATFHDGSPCTADDVAFSIERIKNPKTLSLFTPFLTMIDEARAVGQHEVELRLAFPTSLLAQRLTLVAALSKSALAASPNALKLKPVGTGPYQLVSAVSGKKATLRRFEKYQGRRDLSYDDIVFNVVGDDNARVAGLRSGQWKMGEDIPPSALKGLAASPGLDAKAVPGYYSTVLFFNCGKPPFDDVRVRRAVLYAINRDAITKTAFFGNAEPAWSGEVRPGDPDYTKPSRTYRHDPAEAKRLMAEAGQGARAIPIDILVPNLNVLSSQGPVIEQDLRAIGFEPNLISGTQDSLAHRMVPGDYGIFLVNDNLPLLGLYDAESQLRYFLTGSWATQFLHWDKKQAARVEKLLDAAIAAPDAATRRERLAPVQELVQEEVPFATLHWTDQLTAWSKKLRGFRPLPVEGLALDGVRG